MKLPTDVELSQVISTIRRCKDRNQLYGYFETLTNNDMQFWPDSYYEACADLLRAAMGKDIEANSPSDITPQQRFAAEAEMLLLRSWTGPKDGLPITNEEIKAVEKSAEEVKLDVYKEMLKDIIDNGAEYEYKSPGCWCNDEQKYVSKPCGYDVCSHTCYSGERNPIWRDFDITDGFDEDYEYRKKQPKTWLEENVGDNTPRLEAIKDFYEEFMKRIKNLNTWDGGRKIMIDDLKYIAKEMGVGEA